MHYRIENNIIKTDEIQFDTSHLGGVGKVMFDYMKKHGPKIAQVRSNICF